MPVAGGWGGWLLGVRVGIRLTGEDLKSGPGPDLNCEPRDGPRWTRSCRLGRLLAMPRPHRSGRNRSRAKDGLRWVKSSRRRHRVCSIANASFFLSLRTTGGEMRDRDFQRLLFDYSRRCRERGVDPPYDFVAQEHVPRSFTAAATGTGSRDTGFSPPVSGVSPRKGIGSRVSSRTAMWPFSRLLQGGEMTLPGPVWRTKPQSAITTPAKLPKTTAARTAAFSQRSATSDEATRPISTSCWGVGISRLCDVRRNPFSRKWGFSKRLLSQGCEELGIRYEPFPELGIASKDRAGLSDRASYNRLFARYEATTLPRCRDAVARIAGWIDAGERVAITCYERDSRDCHRSRLATAIVKSASSPLLPRHL